MLKWAEAIRDNADELALLISLEMGKPIRDARTVEIESLIRSVTWYGESADKLEGRHPDVGDNAVAFVSRQPVGIVAIILPWNFPLSMVGYDVAPALILGNSVVVKPSEYAPLSVLRCCELAIEAGVPPSVLAVLPGTGPIAGAALGRHSDIDTVVVTGSAETGRAFLAYSAESNGKRVWPKLGGKAAIIVSDDAESLERAAEAAVWAAFFNQGQMCTGASRILVHGGRYDEFLGLMTQRTSRLRVGDPLLWTTDIGPLISPSSAERLRTALLASVGGACTVHCGGHSVDVLPGGSYFLPTVVCHADTASSLYRDELFGPVTSILPYEGLDEALDKIHAPGFGMALSVWTSSIEKAFRIVRRAKVGTVWVNSFEADDLSVPFGGVKKSGYGRDKSLSALEKYSDLKTAWIQLREISYWT